MGEIVELAVKLNQYNNISAKLKWLRIICNGDYCTHAAIGLSPRLISGKQSASLLISTVIDWSAARSFQ